ncbi:MAG TPA: hypothetical protein VEQ09_06350 [Aquabacterium sp.]|nr:hypothetical protein [Aquabacterium sp.]
MMRGLSTTTLLLGLMLSGCATSPDHYGGHVTEVTENAVTRCQFLQELSSSSGLTGLFGLKGVDDIKHTLMTQAEGLGATHLVWGKPSVGYVSTTLTARTYICK